MLLPMKTRSVRGDDAFERLRRVQSDVEDRIAEAIEQGEFELLEGAGRRLASDPDEDAGERWAAVHLLRTAGAAPEWLDLRLEILSERELIARRMCAHAEWSVSRRDAIRRVPAERLLEHARATEAAERRFQTDLDGSVRELNRRIARHNLLVRAPALQLFPLTIDGLRHLAERGARR